MKKIFWVLLLVSIPVFSFAQDQLLGTWLTGNQKAKIQIFKKDKKYYGKIVWLKNPKDEKGQDKLDDHNPDPAKRKNPIIGIMLLKSFEYDDGEWEDGTIYDPENGKTYSCVLSMPNSKTLNVRGYIGISLLGRTDVWTKVNE